MLLIQLFRPWALLGLTLAAWPVLSQVVDSSAAPGSAAPTPARAASAPGPARAASAPVVRPGPAAAPATAPPAAAQRVEITGGRDSDTEARRRATASKIVIGREEIDKFGDATVGEVLRRLPGVTTPGAPGRGGPPRMRGLGNGFTQLLIDGQRVPPGFSLESLTPEQVERIEVLRAPTAETGARAIAGTINIITREGFKVRLNDLRMGFGLENGQVSPGINWSHNNTSGPLTYTLNASLFKPHRESNSATHTVVDDPATGLVLEERSGRSHSVEKRIGANLSGRLMLRLNEQGDSLSLMPSVFHSEAHSDSDFSLDQTTRRLITPQFYDTGTTVVDSQFTNARLGLMWRQRLGDVRLETNGTGGLWRSVNDNQRREFIATVPSRSYSDLANTREKSLNLTIKASGLAGGAGAVAGAGANPGAPAPAEHSLVGGAEVEAVNRDETRVAVPDLADFGDNLKASTLRLAAYLQDEWQLNPNWGVHAGLRWEGITTRGDTGQGERPTNRSSVWTPLLHAVWKPDPKSRDQVRMSLTRSYRNPPLGALIARPTINREFPICSQPDPNVPACPTNRPNTEPFPDSAGNPALKPELATGIDIAMERYLEGGGVLSANLFHRNISNLIRSDVDLEPVVPWSTTPRYVRRQRNIGNATTSGIELEAKFRLDQLISQAPRVEMRSNLSLYTSRVKSVPGPDNRLDQQAKATGNIGADYRLRGVPITLGGNLNWVPAYTTRLDVDQTTSVSTKQVWDLFVLWTVNPSTGLRLLGSNLDPRDYITTGVNSAVNSLNNNTVERTTSQGFNTNYINWQLRLELKL
jgi:iron complex outermembrane receptor protein